MIEILAITMISVTAVALATAFVTSQLNSYQISRHFHFRL